MAEARIPVPHGPAVDPQSGRFTPEWWKFLHNMWQRSGGGGDITGLFVTDIGSSVQAWDAQLDDIAALAVTDSNFIVADGANWVAESGATARTSLGLGALAIKSTINDGDWSGADLAVVNGGTGASTASGARTALGLVVGTDVQAHGADLDAIEALGSTGIAVRSAADTWVQRTITAAGGAFWADGDGVSGNPTIDVALQVFETTVGQAALDSGGEVILLDAATGETWEVLDIVLSADGTNFSGAGGDRLLDITDGTSIWSVVPAATLQALAVNRWGDAGMPNPATASHLFAASASGTDIMAKYSGGTTDYDAGGLTLRITAYRTA